MKKNIINGKFKFILLPVLLTVCLTIFFVSVSTETPIAHAEDEDDAPTTLDNYLQNEYGTESSFDSAELLLSVSGDDPIVEYVPKEYFMQDGQHMYIGDDYGYYIYTFPDGKYGSGDWIFESFGNKRSIVFGFEIKYERIGDVDEARDGFGYFIRPLFQREFATLMPNGTNDVGIGDYSQWNEYSRTTLSFRQDVFTYAMSCALADGVSKNEGIVLPVPNYVRSSDELNFTEINVFYLTDLIVSASIENAQDVNDGDDDYSIEADNGCFLIGTGFEMSALEYVVEEENLSGFALYTAEAITKTAVSTVLGYIPGGTAISIAMDLFEYLVGMEEYFKKEYFEQTYGNSYYGTIDIPNTKYAQIQLSGHLYKDASIRTQIGNGSNVWLGNGNYYRAVFEIGSGAVNEASWWTVVRHAVSAKVTSLFYDLDPVTANSSFYTDMLNDSRDKPLVENVESDAYIMAVDGEVGGRDSFAFTAPRNGFYELTLANATGVNAEVKNGNSICQASYGNVYYFSEGTEYIITLYNTTSSLKRPSIEIGLITLEADFGDEYSFNLPAGAEIRFQVDLINPFTNVSVEGDGIIITGVSSRMDIILTPLNVTSHDVKADEVSVIVIKNESSTQQSVNIVFSDLMPLPASNNDNGITIINAFRYFKFVPQAGSYIFWYENADAAAVNFSVYSQGNTSAIKTITSDYVLVTGLTTDSTYVIGLYNAYSTTVNIKLLYEAQTGEIQWLINDETVVGDKYTLYNDQTYDVALKINGDKYYATIEVASIAGQQYLTYINNALIVENYFSATVGTTSLRYEIENTIFTGANVDTISGLLDVELINPINYIQANESLALTDTLSYDTEVDVYLKVLDSLIESVDYEVTYQNGFYEDCQINGTYNIGELSDNNTAVFTFEITDLIVYSPLIKITAIVYDGYEYNYSSSMTESTFSFVYGKGSGTASDPYIINCIRHYLQFLIDATVAANNNEYKYWELAADLDISGSEILNFEEFKGSFDGNNHTLSGMEIAIDTESHTYPVYYGWVLKNYGVIENLIFDDVSITGGVCHQGNWVYVGTVCGINQQGGSLNNIIVQNANISVNRNMCKIGGITGVNNGTVENCSFGNLLTFKMSYIFSNGDMGGICGENTGTIDNCIVFADMEYYPSVNNRSAGGIVGYSPSGTIVNCLMLGDLTITGADANIYPNIGPVAGHISSSTIISNITDLLTIYLSNLPSYQRVNTCNDGSRLYGYMG